MAVESRERMALQKQIADLDKQLNDEIASHGKSARLDVSSVTFPMSYWVATAVFVGWAVAGGTLGGVIGEWHAKTWVYSLGLGILLGLFTIWATFKWMARKVKGTKAYDRSESAKIIGLRKQRDDLQKKLDDVNKQDKQYQNKV